MKKSFHIEPKISLKYYINSYGESSKNKLVHYKFDVSLYPTGKKGREWIIDDGDLTVHLRGISEFYGWKKRETKEAMEIVK